MSHLLSTPTHLLTPCWEMCKWRMSSWLTFLSLQETHTVLDKMASIHLKTQVSVWDNEKEDLSCSKELSRICEVGDIYLVSTRGVRCVLHVPSWSGYSNQVLRGASLQRGGDKIRSYQKKNKKEIETVSQIFHWSCVQVGTCVWARDSQRVGCGVSKEPVMSTWFQPISNLITIRWGRRRRSPPSSALQVHQWRKRQPPPGSVMALFAPVESLGYGLFHFFAFWDHLVIKTGSKKNVLLAVSR